MEIESRCESDMSISSGSSPVFIGENNINYYDDLNIHFKNSPPLNSVSLEQNFFANYDNGSPSSNSEVDMNYYQDNYYFRSNDDATYRSMLGEDQAPTPTPNEPEYDPEFESEVNKYIGLLDEEIKQPAILENKKEKKPYDNYIESKKEQYESYYDDFSDEEYEEVPTWHIATLSKKKKLAKNRLADLSKMICFTSSDTRSKIIRMEEDHHSPLCKFEPPKYPKFSREWTNYWKFNCAIKCKLEFEPNHAHTQSCETNVFLHVDSGTSTKTRNISDLEFPDFVMNTVEIIQDFANSTSSDSRYLGREISERPTWKYIKIRSNYKKEILLTICGKGIDAFTRQLKNCFDSGVGRSTNVVSLYTISLKGSQKKYNNNTAAKNIYGSLQLRDKVGPISLHYSPKVNVNFNSVETKLLAKTLQEMLVINKETTVLEVGCNIGVLSLILSQKAEKVLGLSHLEHEKEIASHINSENKINNAFFMVCKPNKIAQDCKPLLNKSITVAILNLDAPSFRKNNDVMRAFRDLPTVWQVAVYGKLTTEFHKYITVLTSHEPGQSDLGPEFIPRRCCILEKVPVDDEFDILIVFERESLIEPSIDVAGPSINLKTEFSDCSRSPKQEIPEPTGPIVKIEKGFGGIDKPFKPFVSAKAAAVRPSKKFGKFDSPLLPKDIKTEHYSNKDVPETVSGPPPPPIDDDDDSTPYIPLPVKKKFQEKKKEKPFSPDLVVYDKNVNIERLLKKRCRRFDCPSPPRTLNRSDDTPSIKNERNFKISPPRRPSRSDETRSKKDERYYETSSNTENKNYNRSPPNTENLKNYNRLSPNPKKNQPITIKKEKDEGKCKQPDYSIKTEKDCLLEVVRREPFPSTAGEDTEKEEGELSPESGDSKNTSTEALNVIIKNEPMDYSEIEAESERRPPESYAMFQSVKIKQEPIDTNNDTSVSEPIKIKNEPRSPSEIDDFENMPTPKHVPVALDNTECPPILQNTSYTLDGSQFSVNPSASFLNIKQEPDESTLNQPEQSNKPFIKIKLEKNCSVPSSHSKSDSDEVNIIQEKTSFHVKVKKEKTKKFEDNGEEPDLRKLLEKQRAIQRQLAENDFTIKRERSQSFEDLKYASSSEKRYKHSSPSLSPKSRNFSHFSKRSRYPESRSPSPKNRGQSPYPYKNRDRSPCLYRNRDQSPYSYNRKDRFPFKNSKYRSRSPSIGRSLSPRSRSGSRRRSPSPYSYRRRSPCYSKRRSRSPYFNKRRSRSPMSPINRSRSPYSPKRNGRFTYNRKALSPVKGFKSTFDSSKNVKCDWVPLKYLKNERRQKSRSRSISPKRIKLSRRTPERRDSRSSLSLSLSPPPHYIKKREQNDKKSKSANRSSLSLSPSPPPNSKNNFKSKNFKTFKNSYLDTTSEVDKRKDKGNDYKDNSKLYVSKNIKKEPTDLLDPEKIKKEPTISINSNLSNSSAISETEAR